MSLDTAGRRACATWADLLPAFPVRQTSRGGRSTRGVELFLESLDVDLEKFSQFGNLRRQFLARDLILLHGGLGWASGGPAGGRSGGLHAIGDGGGYALVGGAPDAIAVERHFDLVELLFQLQSFFPKLVRQRRRGVDGAANCARSEERR